MHMHHQIIGELKIFHNKVQSEKPIGEFGKPRHILVLLSAFAV